MSIKRFYKTAAALPAEGGFAIGVDGRPVKTPLGNPFIVANMALAEICAAEWEAQGEFILPHTMPMTQLVATSLDRIGPERPTILAELVKYARTDLMCYRADYPPDLVELQKQAWQPLLDWAASELGAKLVVTTGVLAVDQPAEALEALEFHLNACDTWTLTAVQAACAAAGSLVLALALAKGRITTAQLFDLSQLEETFQIEQWGEDEDAAIRRAALRFDMDAAGRLLVLA